MNLAAAFCSSLAESAKVIPTIMSPEVLNHPIKFRWRIKLRVISNQSEVCWRSNHLWHASQSVLAACQSHISIKVSADEIVFNFWRFSLIPFHEIFNEFLIKIVPWRNNCLTTRDLKHFSLIVDGSKEKRKFKRRKTFKDIAIIFNYFEIASVATRISIYISVPAAYRCDEANEGSV